MAKPLIAAPSRAYVRGDRIFNNMIELLIHIVGVRHGPEIPVRFHCPACRERDVKGVAWTDTLVTRVFGLVEVGQGEKYHWVCGPCCGRRLWSDFTPEVLSSLDADVVEEQKVLVDRVSPIRITFLAAAYLLFCLPVVCPVFLLLAWLPNGTSRPWFRWAWRLCLLLHVIAVDLLLIRLILQDKQ